MSISLPYSRDRRYLTGMDWIIGTMAHQGAARNDGIGSYSQAILEVEGDLEEAPIRSALDKIAERFPLIHGRIARDWLNLAPYWKVAGRRRIPLEVIDLGASEGQRADKLFSDHVNEPFESNLQHLRLLLIRIGRERSRLGMVFDHRLLDAFGSEMFFRLIDETARGNLDEIAPKVKQTEPAQLDDWKRRFDSGKALNRVLNHLANLDISALSMPPAGCYRPIAILHDSLTIEETRALNKQAGAEIGVPILLPSAAARAIQSMRQALSRELLEGAQFLFFTSANMRQPGQEWERLFFNHFSLMPFTVPTEPAAPVKDMALSLRNQFFTQMKEKIPFIMQHASPLGRIVPFWIGSRLLRLVAKGRMCTFYFACLKDNAYSSGTFLGQEVSNLIHQPLVFSPPGLNICMTEFRGRFNLVISYMRGVIDDPSARRLMRQFKAYLLATSTEPACH